VTVELSVLYHLLQFFSLAVWITC